MALYDTTRAPVGATRFTGRLSATFSTLVATLIAWNEARATRNALSRLSDQELDDIGLTRGDIEDVAVRLSR